MRGEADASTTIDEILVAALLRRARQVRIRREARGVRVALVVGRFVESEQRRDASDLEPMLARLADLARSGRFHVRLIDGRRASCNVELDGARAVLRLSPLRQPASDELAAADRERIIDRGIDDRTGVETPIVKLVNAIFLSSIKKHATQIRIAVGGVRFEIDGVMADEMRPPKALFGALARRISVMASLRDQGGVGTGTIKLLVGRDKLFEFDVIAMGYGDEREIIVLRQAAGAPVTPPDCVEIFTNHLVGGAALDGAERIRIRDAGAWGLVESWRGDALSDAHLLRRCFVEPVIRQLLTYAKATLPEDGGETSGRFALHSDNQPTLSFNLRVASTGTAMVATLACHGSSPPTDTSNEQLRTLANAPITIELCPTCIKRLVPGTTCDCGLPATRATAIVPTFRDRPARRRRGVVLGTFAAAVTVLAWSVGVLGYALFSWGMVGLTIGGVWLAGRRARQPRLPAATLRSGG